MSDGERDAIHHDEAETQGKRYDECGGAPMAAKIPGIHLHIGEEPETAYCAEGDVTIQGPSTGADAEGARDEHGRNG